ncbi:DUF455 family protein, partial [Undibacterium sp.]|uniref:DUF455 family protein n=1 Tax=Undibacterium sp. TaxID=1914977 RepID=UPI00374CB6F0
MPTANMPAELRQVALYWLVQPEARVKADGVRALRDNWLRDELSLDAGAVIAEPANVPGRPDKPDLVAPLDVKRRAMNTVEGRAALIHALAH